jgi:branched-chain amino acid transport system ATP-binding protein
VEAGQVVALLGSNGAGKTTTLNTIAGLVRPARGSIHWRGESIFGEPAFAIVSKGLALSPQGWRLFVSQTIEQNLRLGATALADRAWLNALEGLAPELERDPHVQEIYLGMTTNGAAAPPQT